MNGNKTWIIDHKASLIPSSPMNLDGSDWMLGVYLVSAESQQIARKKFKLFLKNEGMELIETYDICSFEVERFNDNSNRSTQIINANRLITEQGGSCYVFARTSESLAESKHGDE